VAAVNPDEARVGCREPPPWRGCRDAAQSSQAGIEVNPAFRRRANDGPAQTGIAHQGADLRIPDPRGVEPQARRGAHQGSRPGRSWLRHGRERLGGSGRIDADTVWRPAGERLRQSEAGQGGRRVVVHAGKDERCGRPAEQPAQLRLRRSEDGPGRNRSRHVRFSQADRRKDAPIPTALHVVEEQASRGKRKVRLEAGAARQIRPDVVVQRNEGRGGAPTAPFGQTAPELRDLEKRVGGKRGLPGPVERDRRPASSRRGCPGDSTLPAQDRAHGRGPVAATPRRWNRRQHRGSHAGRRYVQRVAGSAGHAKPVGGVEQPLRVRLRVDGLDPFALLEGRTKTDGVQHCQRAVVQHELGLARPQIRHQEIRLHTSATSGPGPGIQPACRTGASGWPARSSRARAAGRSIA
jgi:hypothetical protein